MKATILFPGDYFSFIVPNDSFARRSSGDCNRQSGDSSVQL